MSDYINRKSVTVGLDYIINALNKLITDDSPNDVYTDIKNQVEEIKRGVLNIPSAQPERQKGHWIFDFARNEMTCSECGRTFTGGFDLDNADNFCRHCGSDNRGEQDE